jgi:hypothetical protein
MMRQCRGQSLEAGARSAARTSSSVIPAGALPDASQLPFLPTGASLHSGSSLLQGNNGYLWVVLHAALSLVVAGN